MASDFNCIPDTRLDKWGGDDTFGDRGIEQLNVFATAFSLEEVFRAQHVDSRVFTWFNGSHSVGCRLDRFYTPCASGPQIRDFNCQPFS